MGQKFMFEDNFLGWNFNIGYKTSLPSLWAPQEEGAKKPQQTKPKRTPATKQDENTPQKPLIGIKAKW